MPGANPRGPGPRGAPGGRGTTPQGATSRERILDAAVELFSERGYSATSVEALCRRAGIVKTALYWHFGSKEGLLAAALDRVASRWIEEIHRNALMAGRPLERLDRALDGMRALLEERPELLRLLLAVLLERADSDPALRTTLGGIFRRARESISQGITATLPGLPDTDLVAHTLLSLLQGALLARVADPEQTDLDRLFADLKQTVILVVADRMRRAGQLPEPEPALGPGDADGG